jgi:peptidoglycan hydrolase-like protein with peptidoglycan-binding domain
MTEPVYAQATTSPWDFNTIWETHPNTFPTFQYYSLPTPTYTITASAGTGGVISYAGPLSVMGGANQSYTSIPNSGYTIADVLVDGTSVGPVSTYTFSNVSAPHTISVTFTVVVPSTPPSTSSGGGGYSGGSSPPYGCKDPNASNYNYFSASDPSLCRYATSTVLATSSAATSAAMCVAETYPTKSIRLGAKNDPAEVILLQKYLNTYENAQLPVDGVYSAADDAAVIAWQEKYASDILTPWNITKGTGYVYKTSLQKFKSLFLAQCQGTVASSASQNTNQSVLGKDLQLGMSGDDVRSLQQTLISKNIGVAAQALAKNGATGYFGQLTQSALIEYQKANSIFPAAGYYGAKTRASLGL